MKALLTVTAVVVGFAAAASAAPVSGVIAGGLAAAVKYGFFA